MRYRVRILRRARSDIDRNADWWADHYSTEQALMWSDKVYDQIDTLSEFPESHSLSFENEDFPFEIRDMLVGLGSKRRYRAVFTIRENDVFVLTVRAAEEGHLRPTDVDLQ